MKDLNFPGRSTKIQKTFEGEEFNSEAQDRISDLPDAILCQVLSFLPIKSAAQTGILSKRWRDLWVSVPVLDFDMFLRADFKGHMSTFDSFAKTQMESFIKFVDRLLAVRGNLGLSIQTFRLACDEIDPQCLYTWIRAMRNVEELDLWVWKLGELPRRCHLDFVGESLRVMKIFGEFSLSIPSSTLSFPSLEILHLNRVTYADEMSIKNLLLSCPVLQDLKIKREEWDNVKNFVISVPSVKRLDLGIHIRLMALYDYENDKHIKCNLFVDAPNVEYLRLVDYMSDSITVKCMPSVTESRVSVNKIGKFHHWTSEQKLTYGDNVCGLFHSILNVKRLTIGNCTMQTTNISQLGHLELAFDEVNGAMLLPTILEVSPMLETLILPRGITGPGKQGFSYEEENQRINYLWKPPQNVPHCLLSSLKVVYIDGITGELADELKLLKYFLKNGMVLERVTILCREWIVSRRQMANVEERTSAARALVDRFRGELMNYDRGSVACQLDIQILEPQVAYMLIT